jgi:hypothetical protein
MMTPAQRSMQHTHTNILDPGIGGPSPPEVCPPAASKVKGLACQRSTVSYLIVIHPAVPPKEPTESPVSTMWAWQLARARSLM